MTLIEAHGIPCLFVHGWQVWAFAMRDPEKNILAHILHQGARMIDGQVCLGIGLERKP